jgi:hypothetical protein
MIAVEEETKHTRRCSDGRLCDGRLTRRRDGREPRDDRQAANGASQRVRQGFTMREQDGNQERLLTALQRMNSAG